eukprot:168778-Alexandrium_andersonii.AAC.1
MGPELHSCTGARFSRGGRELHGLTEAHLLLHLRGPRRLLHRQRAPRRRQRSCPCGDPELRGAAVQPASEHRRRSLKIPGPGSIPPAGGPP